MFSQFDDADKDDYLSRLSAQLRRMPPEDRAEAHQELRQHLDALVAAHEELGATPTEAVRAALAQFGEPTQVGRRLMREWNLTTDRARGPLLKLILAAALAQTALTVGVYVVEFSAPRLIQPGWLGAWLTRDSLLEAWYNVCYFFGQYAAALAGVALGMMKPRRMRPEQVIPVAFYAGLLSSVLTHGAWSRFLMTVLHSPMGETISASAYVTLTAERVMECFAAYAAALYSQSGGSRLRLADWKLRVRT